MDVFRYFFTCNVSAAGKTGPVVEVYDFYVAVGSYHAVAAVDGYVQDSGCFVAVCFQPIFVKADAFGSAVYLFQTELAVRGRVWVYLVKENIMKKILCLAISVALLLGALALCAGAAVLPADVGYSEAAVTDVPLDEIPDINELATEEGYDLEKYQAGVSWKISDANGMKSLALLANELAGNGAIGDSCLGRTFYLENDIDMAGVTDYTPIGNDNGNAAENRASGHRFSGTFDGQGHKIKNLVMTSNGEGVVELGVVELGVFGTLKGAVVRNLIIDSSCSFTYNGTSGGARVGSLAAKIANQGEDGNKGVVESASSEPLSSILVGVTGLEPVTSCL